MVKCSIIAVPITQRYALSIVTDSTTPHPTAAPSQNGSSQPGLPIIPPRPITTTPLGSRPQGLPLTLNPHHRILLLPPRLRVRPQRSRLPGRGADIRFNDRGRLR